MRRASQIQAPVQARTHVDWEDVRDIIREDDVDFNNADLEKELARIKAAAEVDVTVEDTTEIDLLGALELLGRVNDMFGGIDRRALERTTAKYQYDAIMKLDGDIANFLNNFDI
jgi:hypothetical protein